jgi:hypothetical protein
MYGGMEGEVVSHEMGRRYGIPVSGCTCEECDHHLLAIWSRSFLRYCGAPSTRPEDTWR